MIIDKKQLFAKFASPNSFKVLAFVLSTASMMSTSQANAHGYISTPKSRVIMCKENGVENPTLPACIAAKAAGNEGLYTPQEVSVGGVKDDHRNYIPDGKLCSVGRDNLAGMDLNRTDWPATKVVPGTTPFTWTNTAAHRTTYFRYYITREAHDLTKPLKWDDLDVIHDSGPAGQQTVATHNVVLPFRTGKHIIYSVWQRNWEVDAAEGFYQCVDVDFGGGITSSTPSSSRSSASVVSSSSVRSSSISSSSSIASVISSSSSLANSSLSNNTCDALPVWNETGVYTAQTYVQSANKRYMAKWYTQGQNPAQFSGQWDVWLDLGACVTTAASSRNSSVASVASSSKSAVASSVGGRCTSPAYVNAASYANNALVQNGGNEYKCTVAGWCTVGGPYAPGTGWAWTNAWTLVQSCL